MTQYVLSTISQPICAQVGFEVVADDKKEAEQIAIYKVRNGEITEFDLNGVIYPYSLPVKFNVRYSNLLDNGNWNVLVETKKISAINISYIEANSAQDAIDQLLSMPIEWSWNNIPLNFNLEIKKIWVNDEFKANPTKIEVVSSSPSPVVGDSLDLTCSVFYYDVNNDPNTLVEAPGSVDLVDWTEIPLFEGAAIFNVIANRAGENIFTFIYTGYNDTIMRYLPSSLNFSINVEKAPSNPVFTSSSLTVNLDELFPVLLNTDTNGNFSYKIEAYDPALPLVKYTIKSGYSTTALTTFLIRFPSDIISGGVSYDVEVVVFENDNFLEGTSMPVSISVS